jgi:tetratricopeptide (TPR) repeat protein
MSRPVWRQRGLVVAVCCAATLVACKSAEERSQGYVARGDQLTKAQNHQSAILEYRNAVAANPQSSEAHYKLAEAFAATNDVRNALVEYVRAADANPDNLDAQLKASQLLILARQYSDAQARLRGVLRKDPTNATALLMLGNALAGLKSFGEAIAANEKAAGLEPTRPSLFLNLGALRFIDGNRAQALQAFRTAVAMQPKSPDTHVGLATYYWATGNQAECEKSLKNALEVGPNDVTAHRMMAAFYYNVGRPALAETHLRRVVEIAGDTASRVTLSDYYVAVNRVEEGVTILEQLSKEKGAYSLARIRIAMIRYIHGRRREAGEIIEDVLAKNPRDTVALATKAHMLLGAAKAQEALAVAQSAVSINVSSTRAHFAEGKALLALGRVAEARKSFREVTRLDPGATEAHLELSRIHLTHDEIDSAIQTAQQAIESHPSSIDARLALARALMVRTEDQGRAEAHLEAMVKLFPRSGEIQHAVGELALARGDRDGARRAFERALQVNRRNWESLDRLITMDLRSGRVADARRRAEAALDASPDAVPALLLTAKAAEGAGDSRVAERHLRRVIELEPDNLDGYTALGAVYLGDRRLDKARAEFIEIAKRQPRSVAPPTMVGILSQAQGERAGAIEWYQRALKVDTRAAVAANNLAWIYAETDQNLDIAHELAQVAYAELREIPEVADTMGWVYYKRNMHAEAIAVLLRCVEKDPTNPLYHFHLGMAYSKRGEDMKARASLQRALKYKLGAPYDEEAKKALSDLLY